MENIRCKVLEEIQFNNSTVDDLIKEDIPNKLHKGSKPAKLINRTDIEAVFEFEGYEKIYHVLIQDNINVKYIIQKEIIL